MKFLRIVPLLLLLASCASAITRLPDLPDAIGPYVLGAGDELRITVFGEDELSGSYKISDSGTVVMPLVGSIPAQGLGIDAFQKQLVSKLVTTALREPHVTVQVTQYRPFFILGEVKNPGSYPYVPNMTVLTAVAIAGGFTFRAQQNEFSVTRVSAGVGKEWYAWRDSRIAPGDTVVVVERHF